MQEDLIPMKIAVFGVGGTGGVLGGYLAAAGNDVTFLARGRHLEAMQQNGLRIHTKHRGDILVRPVQATTAEAYDDTPDVLLVCVKYYNLEDAIVLARRVASPDTLVVPVLNVFGNGGVMQKQLPDTTVLDGCMYVFARIGGPGIIEQPQKTLRCFFGFRPGQEERLAPKARELEQRMQETGIQAHFTDQIQRDALVKFSFVSPMGAAGLYLDAVSDDFQKPGEARDLFVGLVKEVIALGTAMGITFENDLLEKRPAAHGRFGKGHDYLHAAGRGERRQIGIRRPGDPHCRNGKGVRRPHAPVRQNCSLGPGARNPIKEGRALARLSLRCQMSDG